MRITQDCTVEARKDWLREAAHEGSVPAMFELAMLSESFQERRWWLREAARNGWQEAILELADDGC